MQNELLQIGEKVQFKIKIKMNCSISVKKCSSK